MEIEPHGPRQQLASARQLYDQGMFDDAASLYRSVLAKHPANAEANFWMGSIFIAKKDFHQATEYMERATSAAPDHTGVLDRLGMLYDKQKRFEESIKIYDRLAGQHGDGREGMQVFMRRGTALARSDRFEEAVEDFKQVVAIEPKFAHAWLNLGNALIRTGEFEEAVETLFKAHELEPDNPATNESLGRGLIWTKQFPESVEHLSRAQALDPNSVRYLSYKILALRHAGRTDEANDLEGLGDMVLDVRVPHPPEFASLEKWNEALKEEIVNHQALTKEFTKRATRNGAKVDHMFDANKTPLFGLFERQIRQAFEQTVARMPQKPGHPLSLGVAKDCFVSMWANVMYDGGHQVPHNHPRGWYSSCYYNVLPDRVAESGDAHEGWIEFGGSAYDYPEPADAPKRLIQPEPGLMVVFPSYIFHRTVPFFSDQLRISCAFDARPQNWKHS